VQKNAVLLSPDLSKWSITFKWYSIVFKLLTKHFFMDLKRLILVACNLASTISMHSQTLLSISGSGPFKDGSTLVLSTYYSFQSVLPHQKKTYTTVCKNNHFSLQIETSSAEFYILSASSRISSDKIFLSPGIATLIVKDTNLKDIRVFKNSGANDYEDFAKTIKNVTMPAIYSQISERYDEAKRYQDSIQSDALFKDMDSVEARFKLDQATTAIKWIESHPFSLLNTYVMKQYLYPQMDEKDSKKLFMAILPKFKCNSWGQELDYLYKKLSIGSFPPNFFIKDTAEKKVRLTDFKGRYVLIDFWASWCLPCRKTSHYLVNAFNKFGKNDFIIVSVSLDSNKEDWIEAIRKDKLSWTHVSNLSGFSWKNKIVTSYNITSIPANFLLDRKGKIVAKNINLANLEIELNKYLNLSK
jgi:peroxiredoxin